MKGKDASVRGYIGEEPDPSPGPAAPRWPKGPKRVKGESYMAAKGESDATSLQAARKPTYWRRGGFVTRHADGGPVPKEDDGNPGGTGYARGGKLTMAKRKALPSSSFALPGKGKGPSGKGAGSYPIPDENHARNALARVSQHGSSEEKARVRAAVHRKFPGIGQK